MAAAPLAYSIPQRAVHWLSVVLIGYNLIADSALSG